MKSIILIANLCYLLGAIKTPIEIKNYETLKFNLNKLDNYAIFRFFHDFDDENSHEVDYRITDFKTEGSIIIYKSEKIPEKLEDLIKIEDGKFIEPFKEEDFDFYKQDLWYKGYYFIIIQITEFLEENYSGEIFIGNSKRILTFEKNFNHYFKGTYKMPIEFIIPSDHTCNQIIFDSSIDKSEPQIRVMIAQTGKTDKIINPINYDTPIIKNISSGQEYTIQVMNEASDQSETQKFKYFHVNIICNDKIVRRLNNSWYSVNTFYGTYKNTSNYIYIYPEDMNASRYFIVSDNLFYYHLEEYCYYGEDYEDYYVKSTSTEERGENEIKQIIAGNLDRQMIKFRHISGGLILFEFTSIKLTEIIGFSLGSIRIGETKIRLVPSQDISWIGENDTYTQKIPADEVAIFYYNEEKLKNMNKDLNIKYDKGIKLESSSSKYYYFLYCKNETITVEFKLMDRPKEKFPVVAKVFIIIGSLAIILIIFVILIKKECITIDCLSNCFTCKCCSCRRKNYSMEKLTELC